MTMFAPGRGPEVHLELEEGERLLHIARFHWLVLLRDALPPFVVALGAASIALYRAVGGRFLVGGDNNVGGGGLDAVNWFFLLLILGFGVLWWRTQQSDIKLPGFARFVRVAFIVAIIVVLTAVVLFRFSGGRLLYLDPYSAGRASDTLNIALILLTIIAVLYLLYVIRDWHENYLVITNLRVMLDEEEYLVQRRQQLIAISDVQQVNVRAEGYLKYWLGFGTIIVRSFSPRTLTFDYATNPQLIQKIIMDEVNKLRRAEEPELLRQMIEDQVYGHATKPAAIPVQVKERSNRLPSWFFPPNPQIDTQRDIVTWRPSDVFVLLALTKPLLLFAALTAGVVLLTRLGLVGSGGAVLLWLPVLLICGGWALWIRESYVHDVFILNRQQIIDVDRRPFGPESRRQAPLSSIQDISYNVSIWEFVLGYGDVIIETGGAAGGRFTFSHVPNPRGVQATINDYMTDFKRRQKETQIKDTLALLKQYHNVQVEHGEVFEEQFVREEVARTRQTLDEHIHRHVSELLQEAMPVALRREARMAARYELIRTMRRGRLRRRRRSSP